MAVVKPPRNFLRRLSRTSRAFVLRLAEPKKLIWITILIALLLWGVHEVTKDVVTLNVFSASRGVEDHGLTGLYLTNMVADQVAILETTVFAASQHRFQAAVSENIPEIEVPETKISLKSIVQFVRTVVPKRFIRAIVIDGDTVTDGVTLTMIARIHRPGDASPVVIGPFSSSLGDVKKATNKIAEGIVEEIDPVVIANYRYVLDETPVRALDLARTIRAPDARIAADLDLFVGTVLMDEGDLAGARAKFESVLKKYPEHSSALNLLARYYDLTENYPAAAQNYFDALVASPNNPDVLNNLGYYYLDWGDVRKALAFFEKCLQANSSYTWAHRGRAQVYEKIGRPRLAVTALYQGIRESSNDLDRASLYQELGALLSRSNNPRGALSELNDSIKLNPTNYFAYQFRGDALLAIGDTAAASTAYIEALRLTPNKAQAYRDWASSLASRQMYDAASEKYARANLEDPGNFLVLADWGRMLLMAGRFDEGEQRLANAFSPYPAGIRWRWGNALRENGRSRRALNQFWEAARLAHETRIYISMAATEYDLHQYDRGDKDYELAVSNAGYRSGILSEYASVLADQGRIDEAIQVFLRALAVDYYNEPAHIGLANALLRKGLETNAAAEFQAAVDSSLFPSGSYQQWAAAEASHGRYRQAIIHLQQALALDPDDSEARVAFARNLFALGWNDWANRELSRATESSISPANVHLAWAGMLFDKRDFPHAEMHYRLALESLPLLTEAYDGIVRSLKEQAKLSEAQQAAEDGKRASPFDPQAYLIFPRYLHSIGRDLEAIVEYDRVATRFPHQSEPLMGKGELLLRMGQLQGAIDSFERGIARSINNPDLYVRAADALSGNGQFSQANEFYDRALGLDRYFLNALRGKMYVLWQIGHHEEASALCDKTIAVGVDVASSLSHCGRFADARQRESMRLDSYVSHANQLLTEDKDSEAMHVLWLAQEHGISSPDVYKSLGVSHCKQNAFGLAMDYFQQAANDAPWDASVLANFAECLARRAAQDDDRAASQKLIQALRLERDYLPFYGSLDRAPRDKGDAKAAFDRLTKIVPHLDAEARNLLKGRIDILRSIACPEGETCDIKP